MAAVTEGIGLHKAELIDRRQLTWTGPAEVATATAGWVHWFNADRHSSINYHPPITYEQQYRQTSSQRGKLRNPRPPAEPVMWIST